MSTTSFCYLYLDCKEFHQYAGKALDRFNVTLHCCCVENQQQKICPIDLNLLDLKGVTHLTVNRGNSESLHRPSTIIYQPIERLDLKGVTHLTFGGYFNEPIEKLDLKEVTHLTLMDHHNHYQLFNQPIERLDLKVVTHLTFGRCFNEPIERLDLKEVTHLTFGGNFNQPIERLDLKEVTHLTLGGFNQPIERLDLKEVTHLTFGGHFNQPIKRLDMKGVTHLTFGYNFNQSISKMRLEGIKISFSEEMTEQIRQSEMLLATQTLEQVKFTVSLLTQDNIDLKRQVTELTANLTVLCQLVKIMGTVPKIEPTLSTSSGLNVGATIPGIRPSSFDDQGLATIPGVRLASFEDQGLATIAGFHPLATSVKATVQPISFE